MPAMTAYSKIKPRSGPPLDFSFKEISNMQDALYEEAESGFPKSAPLMHVDPENPEETPRAPTLPPRPNVELNTVAVRLGNNKLTSLQGLYEFIVHVVDDPNELRWLDLSCNHLTGIDDVLCQFPNLQVLYLHGNRIEKLSEVAKLAGLQKLTKLSLHGNPLSDKPIYKLYIAGHLPNLKSLDFGTITNVDRDKIDTWFRGHAKRLESRT